MNDWKSWYEKIIEEIAVIATTITMIGETIPALTAASPKTRAPSIESDAPLAVGVLASASYNNSNVIIKINASIKAGKGTPLLWREKLIKRLKMIENKRKKWIEREKLIVWGAVLLWGLNRGSHEFA